MAAVVVTEGCNYGVVNSAPSPLFRDAADSAVRALVQCEPYALPADKYESGWEFMELTFDPQRMF